MSVRDIPASNTGGNFDVSVQVANEDPRLRSGFTAQMIFLGGVKKNVLILPRVAIFLKDGKHIVYVKKGNGYEQREVKSRARTKAEQPLKESTKAKQSQWLIPPRRAK